MLRYIIVFIGFFFIGFAIGELIYGLAQLLVGVLS